MCMVPFVTFGRGVALVLTVLDGLEQHPAGRSLERWLKRSFQKLDS